VTYKNGEVILPPDLLKKLQEYVQGEIIYVPKKDKRRSGWGEICGTKMIILKRNQEIYQGYKNGARISELALNYYLSEDSIKKIVRHARSYD
jgi:Mor family transcriptional regulator